MEKVLKGLIKFQKEVFSKKKELFAGLSGQQKPRAVFVTCSDSRIDPSLLTQTEPGELFIIRNAGNLIPTYGAAIGGSTASLEYGISVLQVKDIIICGHTDCGAMEALLHREKLQELPAVTVWLQHAETTVRIMKDLYAHLQGDELFATTIRENVVVQLDHLKTHPAVATGLRRGNLRLHGWVYSIGTGEVWVCDWEKNAFLNPGEKAG
ncbi:MAG TPA: carbonic anhydrase [Nitrospirales bacterium]|nr:carbonate dehydratase [Nitrospiraceae bacterium]HNP28486.1 carbonic anhydrase [Nitrospirales bacterium]